MSSSLTFGGFYVPPQARTHASYYASASFLTSSQRFNAHRKARRVWGQGYIPHSWALNVGESQLVGFPTSGLYELKLSVDFHSVHA